MLQVSQDIRDLLRRWSWIAITPTIFESSKPPTIHLGILPGRIERISTRMDVSKDLCGEQCYCVDASNHRNRSAATAPVAALLVDLDSSYPIDSTLVRGTKYSVYRKMESAIKSLNVSSESVEQRLQYQLAPPSKPTNLVLELGLQRTRSERCSLWPLGCCH